MRSEWASIVATPPHTGFQDALAFTRSLGDLHLQSYGVSHTPETYWMDLTRMAPAPMAAVGGAVGGAAAAATAAAAAAAADAAAAPLLHRDSPITSPVSAPVPAAAAAAAVVAAVAPAAESVAAAADGAGTDAGGALSDAGGKAVVAAAAAAAVAAAAAEAPAAAPVREVPLVSHPVPICVSSDGIWDNWRFEDVASFLNAPARVERAVLSGRADQACTELMAENLNRGRTNFGSSADNMSAIVLYLVPCVQC